MRAPLGTRLSPFLWHRTQGCRDPQGWEKGTLALMLSRADTTQARCGSTLGTSTEAVCFLLGPAEPVPSSQTWAGCGHAGAGGSSWDHRPCQRTCPLPRAGVLGRVLGPLSPGPPTWRWMKTTEPSSLQVPPCRSTCSIRRIWRKRMPLGRGRGRAGGAATSCVRVPPAPKPEWGVTAPHRHTSAHTLPKYH